MSRAGGARKLVEPVKLDKKAGPRASVDWLPEVWSSYIAKCQGVVSAARALRDLPYGLSDAPEMRALSEALDILDAHAKLPPKRLGRQPSMSLMPRARARADVESAGLLPVAEEIAKRFRVRLDTLFTRDRSWRISRARHALWLEVRNAGFSLMEMAESFGFDHTTIMAGVAKARAEKEKST